MLISSDRRDDVTIIAFSGNLDTMTSPRLSEALSAELDAEAAKLVVDLEQVNYISSAGLRTLLATVKKARQQGGDLRLAAIQDTVNKVFEMSGLTSIFELYATVADAVDSFAA